MLPMLSLLAASGGVLAPESPTSRAFDLAEEFEALQTEPALPHVSALMRVNFASSNDIAMPPSGHDLGGFTWDNLRLEVSGQVGGFELLVNTEAAIAATLATPQVQDAWARTAVSEHLRLTMGRFRSPLLGSSLVEPENLLFILRTTDGQYWFDNRDEGAMLDGAYEALRWSLAVQNGGDGSGNDLALTGRLSFDALGEGADRVEGALASGDGTNLTLGAAYHDDASASAGGDVLALDAFASSGPLAAQLEWLDYGDDGLYGVFADTSPWSVSASYVVVPDKYEVAVRWQDLDDVNDQRALTLGINRYLQGHDCKWQLNYVDVSADSGDVATFAIGLTAHI